MATKSSRRVCDEMNALGSAEKGERSEDVFLGNLGTIVHAQRTTHTKRTNRCSYNYYQLHSRRGASVSLSLSLQYVDKKYCVFAIAYRHLRLPGSSTLFNDFFCCIVSRSFNRDDHIHQEIVYENHITQQLQKWTTVPHTFNFFTTLIVYPSISIVRRHGFRIRVIKITYGAVLVCS